MDKDALSSFIKKTILDAGFNAVGITPANILINVKQNLEEWLNAGMHAQMQFMERNREKRIDAAQLVPGAKSVISILASYYPEQIQAKHIPQVAKYAYGIDYHEVLKEKMKRVWQTISIQIPQLSGRMFTDSAPIHEKRYAQNAGLGWQGKNSCLINKEFGSFLFICEMVVNVELTYDQAFSKNHCGNCTRCIDACPTKAIVSPGIVDSRRCISYLTIENKGEIPAEFASKITNQLFGCDICQDVCPWNKKKSVVNVFEEFRMNPNLNLTQDQWLDLGEDEFKMKYNRSPLSRCGWKGIQRNLKSLSVDSKLEK